MDFLRELIDSLGHPKAEVSKSFKQRLVEADKFSDWEEARGNYCHHYPICVRKILGDQTLISMASEIFPGTDSGIFETSAATQSDSTAWYSVSLISYQHPGQRESFRRFAKILAACVVQHFDARLHWGKYFPLSVFLARKHYPAMERFCRLRRVYDPNGRFLNAWTSELLDKRSAHQDHEST